MSCSAVSRFSYILTICKQTWTPNVFKLPFLSVCCWIRMTKSKLSFHADPILQRPHYLLLTSYLICRWHFPLCTSNQDLPFPCMHSIDFPNLTKSSLLAGLHLWWSYLNGSAITVEEILSCGWGLKTNYETRVERQNNWVWNEFKDGFYTAWAYKSRHRRATVSVYNGRFFSGMIECIIAISDAVFWLSILLKP